MDGYIDSRLAQNTVNNGSAPLTFSYLQNRPCPQPQPRPGPGPGPIYMTNSLCVQFLILFLVRVASEDEDYSDRN